MTDPVAETIRSYELIAADYALRNATATDRHHAHQAAFQSLVGSRALVADAGCGPGRDAAWFRARGLRVMGFDRSREMVRRAAAAGVPVAYGDLRALPVRAGALDGLWSAAALLHVPRPEVAATLGGWRRVLRDGGVLGLSTSLGGNDGWEVVPYDVPAQQMPGDVRRWFVHHDADELLGLVAAAGFRVESSAEGVASRRWLMMLATAT
ncbi:MAG TPA: methyltransferase domain-containing protein [Frankiaceae bacterium]|nr:methyltransferase domain-containing protein [Frankiaceae bacterium]